ncbi:homeobox protein prospero-like [Amphibalanus amphitrite]|uniref:homeobox protein prospero-like n=1 Tax=Amphibalanus amphitrite TaxID=1232801 RepID=UPI001C910B01|nr:homeobox protein prospero-like [Amphibalanus amphitrite]
MTSVLAPCSVSAMGVSRVERTAPQLDNAMLREILGRGGPAGRHLSASPPPSEPGAAERSSAEMPSPPGSPSEDKKSRLESIVSGMQPAAAASPQPVNGCKKRKLYQPVQHEAAARSGSDSEPEPEQPEPELGDGAAHSELSSVRSQLALMQERYAQLYREQAAAINKQEQEQRDQEPDQEPQTPEQSPERPRAEAAARPTPTRPDDTPAASFIDYARRVLSADLKSKESERRPRPAAPAADVQGLADALKAELATSLTGLVDSIVERWAQQRRAQVKAAEAESQASPRAEILRRISQHNGRFPAAAAAAAAAAALGGELPPFGLPLRPPTSMAHMYPPHKGFSGLSPAAYGLPPFCAPSPGGQQEQESPLSLVVTPKRKRQKVSDPRLGHLDSDSPPPPAAAAPPAPRTLPGRLPDSPFLGYPYYPAATRSPSASPPSSRPTMLHPALLSAGRRSPPDPLSFRRDSAVERSDGLSMDAGYQLGETTHHHSPAGFHAKFDARSGLSLTADFSSTLTPMHLRKAKLMFFWSRYPSSSVLKSFFPDIKFNKNNTAQLVKWFSNFREFFYIQMEKHSRQALSEGVKSAEELVVTPDCELMRVINLHYNRNNHIEIPADFISVAEAALREFFSALQAGKDAEPSWKKAIYKIIARLDQNVPEYFRSPSFLEQLE